MRFRFSLSLFFALYLLQAQTPSYIHYGVRDGLPGNQVYCGLQDHRGVLWFGTDKGLAYFDGMRFKSYGVEDGLPDPEVLNMKEDSIGRIWLFCFRKRPCYWFQGRIITEKQDAMLAKLEFNSGTDNMTEGEHGRLWFTGGHKIYCLEPGKLNSFDISEGSVYKILEKDKVFIALGTPIIGKIDFRGKFELLKTINHNAHTSPFVGMATSGSKILYSYSNTLILFEWRDGRVIELERRHISKGTVTTDLRGRFWLCSSSGNTTCFDNSEQTLANPTIYMPGQKITYMFEDRQGTFWFCTFNDGVYAQPKNTPLKFGITNGQVAQNIRSLSRTPDGRILFGNDVGQASALKKDQITTYGFDSNEEVNRVRQIVPTSNSSFWAATDNGLFFYDANNHKKKRMNSATQSVKGFLYSGDILWTATHSGLFSYSLKNQEIKRWFTARTTAIEYDSDKYVWIGGIDGFYSQADGFQTNWGDRFPDLKSRIVSIVNNKNRQLWVVTPEKGLLKAIVSAGRVVQVAQINNILKKPIKNIQALYLEPTGTLWMATNSGTFSLGSNEKITHVNYSNGLADNDVNAIVAHNDTLWAGTIFGLSQVALKTMQENGNFKSLMTAIHYQQNNQNTVIELLDSLPKNHQFMLPSDALSIGLDLAGLDFRSRKNLEFEVIQSERLLPVYWWTYRNLVNCMKNYFRERMDTIQSESGNINLRSDLPAGKYILRVTALSATGVQSLQPDIWVFVKKPLWYELFWLYFIFSIILIYVTWRIYFFRISHKNISIIASTLKLQALQSQMNPHFIGNAVNSIQQFIYPARPEQVSEYISIFTHLLRRTMNFSEKILIRFEEDLSYNKEYLQMTQLRFEERFKYEIIGAESIPLETPIPSILIQPFLENATLHGIAPVGDAIVRLEYKLKDGYLHCTITDNGIGVNAALGQKNLSGSKHESKGLSILNKKIKNLNYLYDLDIHFDIQDLTDIQTSGTGTKVSLCFSVNKAWTLKINLHNQSLSKDDTLFTR